LVIVVIRAINHMRWMPSRVGRLEIDYSGGTETLTFANGAAPDLTDWHFV